MNGISLSLIGGCGVLPAAPSTEETVGFYGPLFGRLVGEVPHAAPVTRFMGFECALDETRTFRFFGIAVDAPQQPPPGLTGWFFEGDCLKVRTGTETSVLPVSWTWTAGMAEGRPLGEFSSTSPDALIAASGGMAADGRDGERRLFSLSAHAPVDVTRKADDAVLLVDPDPAWLDRFADMAAWLRGRLPAAWHARIEHYGSTAIPGMPAKPVVDMLVEVPSFEAARASVLPLVNTAEWEYWLYGDHMILIRRESLMGKRTHHVHLAPKGHRVWDGLAFRDALCADPEAARAYAELKRTLAAAHTSDREAYTDAKTAFVTRITARALGADAQAPTS